MPYCINSSVLEIFRIGPGPSSSHTIAPMRAAREFVRRCTSLPQAVLDRAVRVSVDLYGSLALTGKGHGTDKAVAAGLLGAEPETCDTDWLHALLPPGGGYDIPLGGRQVRLEAESIALRRREANPYRYANAMKFRLLDAGGETVFEDVAYSTGGGAVEYENPRDADSREPGEAAYRYRDWATFLRLVDKYGLPPAGIAMENEKAVTGRTAEEIRAREKAILDAMEESVARGLATIGRLEGARARSAWNAARNTCCGSPEPRWPTAAYLRGLMHTRLPPPKRMRRATGLSPPPPAALPGFSPELCISCAKTAKSPLRLCRTGCLSPA